MSLDKLKKVCLEATIGPWTWRADGIINKYIDDNAVVVSGDECKEMDPANCRFISTFDPSLVAKLLAVVEAARQHYPVAIGHMAHCALVGSSGQDDCTCGEYRSRVALGRALAAIEE